MKPAAFEYFRPGTLDEAVDLLQRYDPEAKILAGGQSLVPLMNFRLAQPRFLIDTNGIRDLSYIREGNGTIAVGALTRHAEIEASPLIEEKCPLVSEAVRCVGHRTIRNRATIGGSLAHADPAAEFPCVLAALVFPRYIAAIPNFLILSRFGLIDTYTALILPFFASSFCIFLLRQYILTIPEDFFDAAKIEGCGIIRSIVQILVPQRQRIDPLRHQLQHRVLDQIRVPLILETLRKLSNDSKARFHFPQQQPTRIRGDHSAVKIALDFSSAQPLKLKPL